MHYRLYAPALICLALSLSLAGCSGEKKPKPEPEMKEIPTTEGTNDLANSPEAKLVFLGKKYYETAMYREAQDNFRAIMSSYPLSAYAEFAEIKNADCIFDTEDYIVAAQAYEDFLRARPASDAAPYVLYRAARSNQLAQKGLGRDVATLDKAVKFYDELATKYPDSNYALTAKELRAEAHKMLSDYEQSVAKFYERQGRTKAAEARMQVAEQRWAPVIAKDQEELKTVAAQREQQILVASKSAYAPLPLVPQPVIKSPDNEPLATEPIPDAKYRIYKVDCRTGSPSQIMLYLDKDWTGEEADWLGSNSEISPEGGALTVQFPQTSGRTLNINCLGTSDLSLTSTGQLTLKTEHSGQLASLSNPPRLLIVLN